MNQIDEFFQLDLPPVAYRVGNRISNWIGQALVKPWDRRLLGLARLPIRCVLDVGANEGQFARHIQRIFPQADLYLFEPLPIAVAHLQRWVDQQNRVQRRVHLFPVAVGDRAQPIALQQHLYFSASSSILPTTNHCQDLYPITRKQTTITVPQRPLDQVLAELPNPPATEILIKLDVQGYEDRVIRGGMETFQRAIACIVEVSIDRLYEGQARFQDIFQLLSQLGFDYIGNLDQVHGADGRVIFLNAVFCRRDCRES